METKPIKVISVINGILITTMTYLTFFIVDYNTVLTSIKQNQMLNYILEHWNYLVAAIMVGLTFRWVEWTFSQKLKKGLLKIKQEFTEEQKDIINYSLELKKIIMPDLSLTQNLIRGVVFPITGENELYDLLEYGVFEKEIFHIDDLEKFGVSPEIISKLRKKYYTDKVIEQI